MSKMSKIAMLGVGAAATLGFPSLLGAGALYYAYNKRQYKKDQKTPLELGGFMTNQLDSLDDTRTSHWYQWPSTKQGIADKEQLRGRLIENINLQISTNIFGDNNPFEIYKQSLTQTSPLSKAPADNEGINLARDIIKNRYDNVNNSTASDLNKNIALCKQAFERGITSINKSMTDGNISDPRTIAKQLHALRFDTYNIISSKNNAVVDAQIKASNDLFDAAIMLHKEPDVVLPDDIQQDAIALLAALESSGQLDKSSDDPAAQLSNNDDPIAEVSDTISPKDLSPEEKQANGLKNLKALKTSETNRLTNESKTRNQSLNNKLASLAEDHMLNMNREINAGYLLNRLSDKQQSQYAQQNIFIESSAEGEIARAPEQKSNVTLFKEVRDLPKGEDNKQGMTTDSGFIEYKEGVYNIDTSKLSRHSLRGSLKDQASMVATEFSSINWNAKAIKYDEKNRKVVDHQAVAKLAGEQVLATILHSGLDPKRSFVTPQTGVDQSDNAILDEKINVLKFKDSDTYKHMAPKDKIKFDKDYDKAIEARKGDVSVDLFSDNKTKHKDNLAQFPSASGETATPASNHAASGR